MANITIIGRTIDLFEKNTDTYMCHIRNGTLIFTPNLGVLSETNHSMIKEIKAVKPFYISWSNLVDYIHPQSFHNIAKNVSCKDTAHYIHSYNWTSRVYGENIFDLSTKFHLHFFSAGLVYLGNSKSIFMGFTEQATPHFRDICGVALGRYFVNKFFQYFLEGKGVNCSCFNGSTLLEVPYPFSRGVTAEYIIFVYK